MNKAVSQSEERTVPCLMNAWHNNQHALLMCLYKHTHDEFLSQDILHEVFLRAMGTKKSFCDVQNAKAWLFKAANNLVIDQARKRLFLPLEESQIEQEEVQEMAPVDSLAVCLPRVLNELKARDRDLLKACDIQGMTQKNYAALHGLSLAAVKSRLIRARLKLKAQLQLSCRVKLDENQQVCCFTARNKK